MLAFGTIMDHGAYIEDKDLHLCDYTKRRKVRWIEKKSMQQLDKVFYKIKANRHSISSIADYGDYIDNSIFNLFTKNDVTHFVIDVKHEGDIDLYDLAEMLSSMKKLTEYINEEFEFNEDVSNLKAQLSLQSPGSIVTKLLKGRTLIVLASLMLYISCNDIQQVKPEHRSYVEKTAKDNADTVALIKKSMDQMDSIVKEKKLY